MEGGVVVNMRVCERGFMTVYIKEGEGKGSCQGHGFDHKRWGGGGGVVVNMKGGGM